MLRSVALGSFAAFAALACGSANDSGLFAGSPAGLPQAGQSGSGGGSGAAGAAGGAGKGAGGSGMGGSGAGGASAGGFGGSAGGASGGMGGTRPAVECAEACAGIAADLMPSYSAPAQPDMKAREAKT